MPWNADSQDLNKPNEPKGRKEPNKPDGSLVSIQWPLGIDHRAAIVRKVTTIILVGGIGNKKPRGWL